MKKILIIAVAVVSFGSLKLMAAPPNVYNFFNSTGPTSIATGAGTLFSVHITSGAPLDYAVCYDSSAPSGYLSGLTALTGGTTNVPELMRVVVTSVTATGNPQGFMPTAVPVVNFTNGLICTQSAQQRTNIYYRQPQ